jgi:hypothetical protein
VIIVKGAVKASYLVERSCGIGRRGSAALADENKKPLPFYRKGRVVPIGN